MIIKCLKQQGGWPAERCFKQAHEFEPMKTIGVS